MKNLKEILEKSWSLIDVTASDFMLVLLDGSQCLAFLLNYRDAYWLIEGPNDGGVWELYIFY